MKRISVAGIGDPGCSNLLGQVLLLYDRYLGFHRVSDETLLVRAVMHLIEFFRGRFLFSLPGDLGMQLDPSDCQPAFRILFHMADRLVGVFVENKLLFTCDGEKGEHVTTGEGSDKRFLGIDVGWITKISRRCSG